MSVSVEYLCCQAEVSARADPSSRGVIPGVCVCVCVCVCVSSSVIQ
jgi:hypothetical protein